MKSSKSAVILVESGVQDQEFWYPYYRLQEAGFDVTVVGPITDGIKGKYGIPIQVNKSFSSLRYLSPNPHIIIVPGGWECPEKLRMNQDVLDYLMIQHQDGVVIGTICHGPQVLISAGLAKGRKMTCYKGMKDDLINAGAEYVDAPVVIDGSIVSAQHYRDNPVFMKTLLEIGNNHEQ